MNAIKPGGNSIGIMSSVAHLSIYHSYYHDISQPDFCSSRSIFLIFDLITDADADKSEFFTEPGITIPLMSGEHISNINLAYWFHSLEALNTKLCQPMSRLNFGSKRETL